MKVKSEIEIAQSCLTLRDPMDCGLPGSSFHGIFQARVLEWGAIAFSETKFSPNEKTRKSGQPLPLYLVFYMQGGEEVKAAFVRD